VLFLIFGLLLVWPRLRRSYRDLKLQKKVSAVGADILHRVVLRMVWMVLSASITCF
jgi:hypothetical protein